MASLAELLAYQQKQKEMLDEVSGQPTDLEKAVQQQFGMQPNMDRAALLPYKSKTQGWVAPEAVYQLAKLLASPMTALKGGDISTKEALEGGQTLSGFMTPVGLASPIQQGVARTFIGPKSKSWDQAAYELARQMEKEGKSLEEIHAATGTFRTPDNLWKQEVSDVGATYEPKPALQKAKATAQANAQITQDALDLRLMLDYGDSPEQAVKYLTQSMRGGVAPHPDALTLAQMLPASQLSQIVASKTTPKPSNFNAPFFDVYKNPEVQAAYPELQSRTGLSYRGRTAKDLGGSEATFNPITNTISMNVKTGQPVSTLTHELQHAIQEREGWEPGGSVTNFDPSLGSEQTRYQLYRRLLGEAEARATEKRMPLTMEERRKRYPLLDYTSADTSGEAFHPSEFLTQAEKDSDKARNLARKFMVQK